MSRLKCCILDCRTDISGLLKTKASSALLRVFPMLQSFGLSGLKLSWLASSYWSCSMLHLYTHVCSAGCPSTSEGCHSLHHLMNYDSRSTFKQWSCGHCRPRTEGRSFKGYVNLLRFSQSLTDLICLLRLACHLCTPLSALLGRRTLHSASCIYASLHGLFGSSHMWAAHHMASAILQFTFWTSSIGFQQKP